MPADAVVCAACAAARPRLHLRVAGDAGDAGLIPTTDRYGTALADICRCPSCGHMQLCRMPPVTQLDAAYGEAASGDYLEEEAGQRATAAALLERIEAEVGVGSMLDLGCWVGFLLAVARDRGWETLGVEPSEFASAHARDRLGLDVRTASLLDAELEPGAFDAIVLADVIEHLIDPARALAEIAPALRPGGVLALALPDAGSRLARALGRRWWSVIPTHVHYFTRASLTVLLERCGFRVLSITSAPKTFTGRYYLRRLGGYAPRGSAAAVAVAGRLGLGERLFTPDFRDRMLVLAALRSPAPTPRRT